ncbi:MAG: DUF1284 domain-containing protein [Alphaproteobacteria bacterium]|nr:DUF1284 domain-containing protein [Alphaproteobacteria bacterium]
MKQKMIDMLKFRPHHFLCTIGYEGKGYSEPFTDNYDKIAEQLRVPDGDQTEIQVVFHTDDICAPCPHQRGLLCATQKKIASLDRRHCDALNLMENEILMWVDAKKRIKQKISIDTFHEICKGCQWKALGVCEEALRKLHENNEL